MNKTLVSEAGKAPKFTPLVSFVESSFFTKLSELKLDQFKLDSSQQRISGFTTHPSKLNKFNDTPAINLDSDSFSNTEDKSNVRVPGHIVNVNTVEEFKSLDKQALLKEWGKEVQQKILEYDNLDFDNFNQFFVLSFSDLKKYKFYYWLAYPVLGAPWVEDDPQGNLSVKDEDIQNHLTNGVNQLIQVDESGNLQESLTVPSNKHGKFVFIDTCLSKDQRPGIQLKNYLYFLAYRGFDKCSVFCYRPNGRSFSLNLKLSSPLSEELKITGWERTSQGKLGPKLADLGSLIDPTQLAAQAVDLNLKLMKWRIAPELDLDTINSQRVLLLGAGTLGSYVARALMGWGVRDITFVDNGRISYSNPVRQPLFSFKDCFSDNGQGEPKAPRAAAALKEIFPGANSNGIAMEVPMIGHAVTDEKSQKQSFEDLNQLFDEHDVIYLLMDSRESRWLPTLLGYAKNKLVINAALGFDSYLVMRHGNLSQRLGCYYCNDVVAPSDSLTDRTLDQMCTVTRPGVALLASSLAVELMVSVLQHPDKANAPASTSDNLESKFGEVPHQIRGFLHNFQQHKLHAPSFKQCSACSDIVVEQFKENGWNFVKNCLNDSGYLEDICGLKQVQQEADLASAELIKDLEIEDDDEDSEWLS